MSDLTAEELEQFTDVMVDKLALVSVSSVGDRGHLPLRRDEIQQVIVDTELLTTGKVPLERWLEDPQSAG